MPPKLLLPTWTVENFKPVALQVLDTHTKTERVDYKFCVPENLLDELLDCLRSLDFAVVDLGNGVTVNEYKTVYFDDEHYTSFHHHRCGKLPRKKWRYRLYKATGESFLEEKTKTKSKKTIKKRVLVSEKDDFATILQQEFDASNLQKSLSIHYKRVSFLSSSTNVKVTLDRFLTVEQTKILPNFLILEIKVPKNGGRTFSILKKFLHSHRIQEISFSKYCVGLCYKYSHLPRNKWKQVFKKYIY
ncbi:hypothetical protein CSB37_01130 [bacterium DOLZORAL124_38_8]|nr:MAG: hypothetical protein CSB37_01130 [bacterium DOLZORAL124_38_8]